MFDKLVKEQPSKISCKDQTLSLSEILKINTSDPSTGPLRIPTQNKRPADVTLASGYTSMLIMSLLSLIIWVIHFTPLPSLPDECNKLCLISMTVFYIHFPVLLQGTSYFCM